VSVPVASPSVRARNPEFAASKPMNETRVRCSTWGVARGNVRSTEPQAGVFSPCLRADEETEIKVVGCVSPEIEAPASDIDPLILNVTEAGRERPTYGFPEINHAPTGSRAEHPPLQASPG
jgi:hypothetical protein